MSDFKADRAVIAAATAGPWKYSDKDGGYIHNGTEKDGEVVVCGDYDWCEDIPCLCISEQNTAFVIAARTRWPEALDEVERLQSENAALREAQRWIAVSQKPPVFDCVEYLLWDGEDVYVGYWRDDADVWDNPRSGWVGKSCSEDGYAISAKITHYMPLPTAPQEGE